MEKELIYGIIGCGSFGNIHMTALKDVEGIKVTALCDAHIENAEEANKKYKYNAKCYSDFNVMLDENKFDVVLVATADHVHKDATVKALKSGANVLCEKPMALKLEECKEMLQAEKESGKLLMVGQICRYTPAFVKAKEIIEGGLIGDLYFVESEYAHDYSMIPGTDNWRMHPDRHPIIGGGCHAIDLLRWIAGNPSEVTAYSNNKVLTDWPISDTTIAIMKFPNGVIGKVFTSIGCKRNYTMRSVFYGTKGTIICDNTSQTLTLHMEKSSQHGSFADGFFGTGSERNIPHPIAVGVNNHNAQAEHMAMKEAILEGKPLLTTGREGANTVAVCVAVVESAKKGLPVEVDYNF